MAGGQAPVGVNVTTESTEILAANSNRQWAVVVNDSDAVIYAAVDQDAELNKGIRLNANGGVLILSKLGDMYSAGSVNGIHGGSGNKKVVAQEGE